MSIHIDPHALHIFAGEADSRSVDLHQVQLKIELPPDILGSFDEAKELVKTIKSHTSEVNQRLQATSDALSGLSRAASHAAKLAGASDAEIATRMKHINREVDGARRRLAEPKA